jgi:hypothetical protein
MIYDVDFFALVEKFKFILATVLSDFKEKVFRKN